MTITGYIHASELERLVYKKLHDIGITLESYPIDPYELIIAEGIILQETSFDNANIKGMIVHGPSVTGILINGNRSATSKRFIAMHELAHHWFHPHSTELVCLEDYSSLKKGMEWQANSVASFALMPSDLVKDLFYSCEGDMRFMSDYFGVSKESITYRIKELKLSIPKKRIFYNYTDDRDQALISLESNWLYGGL